MRKDIRDGNTPLTVFPCQSNLQCRLIQDLRASSYEPGDVGEEMRDETLRTSAWEASNRASSVTGSKFVVCSYGTFQPGRPG